MNCVVCNKKKSDFFLSYLKKHVCYKCLTRMNYRRFKNEIRDKIENIGEFEIIDKGDACSALCVYFFKKLFPNSKVILGKSGLSCESLDDLCESMLTVFFKGEKIEKSDKLKPMIGILIKEAEAICDYLKLEYKKSKPSDIKQVIYDVEKTRPGTMFSMGNLYKTISEQLYRN